MVFIERDNIFVGRRTVTGLGGLQPNPQSCGCRPGVSQWHAGFQCSQGTRSQTATTESCLRRAHWSETPLTPSTSAEAVKYIGGLDSHFIWCKQLVTKAMVLYCTGLGHELRMISVFQHLKWICMEAVKQLGNTERHSLKAPCLVVVAARRPPSLAEDASARRDRVSQPKHPGTTTTFHPLQIYVPLQIL